jgi:CRP-like cAMP-binding protein
MQNNIRQNIETKLNQKLTDAEFEKLNDWFVPIQLESKMQFVNEGKVCRNLYFVDAGATHTFIIDKKGESHTVQFGLEGYWIGDMYSFFSGKPAIFNVETLESTTLFAMTHADFEKACKQIPKFEMFFRILVQNGYLSSLKRIAKSFSEDAEQRYLSLIKNHPDIPQRVPQYLVASYLGIKPQSLSRIRQNLIKRK